MQSELLDDLLSQKEQIIVTIERPRKRTPRLTLSLDKSDITVSGANTAVRLPYCDLIGVTEENVQKGLYRVRLNSFPKRSRCFGADRRTYESFEIWMEMGAAQYDRFKLDILRRITGRQISRLAALKVIVYLNPNAGANSSKHFRNMEHFLSFTNFTFDLVRTTARDHCKQHLATIDINAYQAVIIISGDGLMHQFVNSVVCGKIPVSHVPGGSGNAFSKAQTTLANEECRDEEAMFLMVKGKTRTMNLVKMELEKEPEPIYSFLSLEWAFLADIDMNSEFLRCIGGFRFQVYSVYRILALRRYNGRLSYSTTSTKLPSLDQEITDPSFVKLEKNFLNAIFLSIPFISDQYEWGPLLKVQDEAVDMQLITAEHGRWQLIKYLLSSSSGDHFDKQRKAPKEGFQFDYLNIKSYRLQPLGEGQDMGLYGIDGERYEAQRMQASISDRKVLTFA